MLMTPPAAFAATFEAIMAAVKKNGGDDSRSSLNDPKR
jgi:hypothetical protein